jgi:L-histidine N-alpha-methyltransferase
MRLRSNRRQTVHLSELNLAVSLGDGEEIRTEISAKFRHGRIVDELAAAGLRLVRWWTDPADDFALSIYDLP